MTRRLLQLLGVTATVGLAALAMRTVAGQAPATPALETAAVAKTGPALTTPWGEPDLQGIWTRDADIPLQRPAKYTRPRLLYRRGTRRTSIDRLRASSLETAPKAAARGEPRGTSNGEFNQAIFTTHLPIGKRTSLIVDPPDGRIPPLTPEAQHAGNVLRQFQLALLQPTEACKEQQPGCAGGAYGPVSARRNETSPTYLSAGGGIINRADGPEERGLERALHGAVCRILVVSRAVSVGSCRLPGTISMFYDVGPGTRMAAQHPDHDGPASAFDHPPVVGRLTWSLGG